MSLTATYTQVNSQSDKWIATFTVGGKYYAIREPYGGLYEILNGNTTYKRNLGPVDVWGAIDCDGSYIYRLNASNILKMNPADGSIPCSSSISDLRSVGVDTANGRVFAITNAGALYVFTTNNMTASYVTHLGAATYGPKMVYLNGVLYIPVYGGQIKKYVVGGALTTLSNTSPLGWLSFSTDGTYIYGTVDNGYIYRIDPTDATAMEFLSGDSAGRAWYSNTYVNGELWAAAYNGYCYKVALPPPSTPPATPTSSVSTSTIYTDTAVTLSCSTSGATIKYTTDGTTPSASNGTTYSAPFTISATTTIKFCAIKDGYLTAGTDVVLTWAGLFTQLASITGSEYQWIVLGYYNNLLYGVLIDNATTQTISPTLYSINPNTGELTLLSTLTFTPYSMTIGGDKIYLSNLTSRYISEYNLSGTLTNTYECGTSTPYAAIVGIVYVGGKVYAFSGNGQSRPYYFEITPGNTNVSQISFTGVYSDSCSTVAWTDGTYAYYARASNVYKVNPATGATVLYGTTSSGSIGLYNTYLSGTVVTRYGTSLYTSKENENYSRLLSYPNPNSISIFYMTNDGTYIYGSSGTGTAKIYKIRVILDTGTPSIYKSGAWKAENALFVRHNSTWQSANKAFKVKNGLWTRIY